MHQDDYWEDAQAWIAPVEAQRRGKEEEPLLEKEFVQLRSVTGKLSWPARQSAPQLAFGCSRLQQQFGTDAGGQRTAKVKHLKEANALVKRGSKRRSKLHFKKAQLDQLCVATFSDAAWANCEGHGSQAGFVSFLTAKGCEDSWQPASLVEWSSHKLRRVVKSTLAAEAGALSAAHDRNEFARVVAAMMLGKSSRSKEEIHVRA